MRSVPKLMRDMELAKKQDLREKQKKQANSASK